MKLTNEEIEYIKSKILVIPHGVDHDLFKPIFDDRDKPFTFLSCGGWANGLNDRKGLQFLFKAFNEEFDKEEPVELLVKINTAYCGPGWNLSKEMEKLELVDKGEKIKISVESVDFKSLPLFYNSGDVYVCSTMGEAFGMPIMEAMSCAKPCIVTNFGGQTDFVNSENGWLIDYDLVENTWDVMYEDVKWAKPKIEHLRKLLRNAYDKRDLVKEKGLMALKDSEVYSWEKSAEIIKDLLKWALSE